MKHPFFAVLLLVATRALAIAAGHLIPDVPNYDQELFPINHEYSQVEPGDCLPVACTMLHGYHDSHGWPRLIPFGGNHVTAEPRKNPDRPYPGNAWGIDTVVRKYKAQLNYQPTSGTCFGSWSTHLANYLGDNLLKVIHHFEPMSAFSREDDDDVSWTRLQSTLNSNLPCVLVIVGLRIPPLVGANDSYKWDIDGSFGPMLELSANHVVCAVGWSDNGGRWIQCNMGWSYAWRTWFNYDSDDDWYVSQIAPGGTPSGEDDDAYEDNDVLTSAREITPGRIEHLRCLDSLFVDGNFQKNYGDWYRIDVAYGQTLAAKISFSHSDGDLDLRVFGPDRKPVGSSEGKLDSESVSVTPSEGGTHYILVYGFQNAINLDYTLTTELEGVIRHAPTLEVPQADTSACGFTARWSPVPGATWYRVEILGPGFPFWEFRQAGAATSLRISDLPAGAVYFCRVSAGNASSLGPASTPIQVTLPGGLNIPPETPLNVSPPDGAAGQMLNVVLKSSAFVDPDGNSHAASQWRVYTGANGELVYDSGAEPGPNTLHEVPDRRLSYSTAYFWQVRHQDRCGAWSPYSLPSTFSTMAAPPATVPTLAPAGFPDGQLKLRIDGAAGGRFMILISSDLENWSPGVVSTLPADGTLLVTDPLTNRASRFYRAVLLSP